MLVHLLPSIGDPQAAVDAFQKDNRISLCGNFIDQSCRRGNQLDCGIVGRICRINSDSWRSHTGRR